MPAERWVCLDVGETLIDETRVWSTWAEVLELPPFTVMGVLGATVAAGGDHRDALARLGGPGWRDRIPEVERRYRGFVASDLYGDALECLAALRSTGYRVAVVANQPAARHGQLLALGVRPDLMAMSEALGVAKPAPEFFAVALARMGAAAADVAYVGDRLDNDIVPAAAAGLRTCWLRRGPWGFVQTDGAGHADAVIDSLAALPDAADRVFAAARR